MRSQWKVALLSPALLGLLLPGSTVQAEDFRVSQASGRGSASLDDSQVVRLVESLRLVATRSSAPKSATLYSDWRVSQRNIGPWTKQCLSTEATPQEFDSNPETASKVVTCVVRSVLTTEMKASEQDEILAIRRTAAWWMTGDASRYNSPGTAAYTQRVLDTYQTTAVPSTPIAQAPQPTLAKMTPAPKAPEKKPAEAKAPEKKPAEVKAPEKPDAAKPAGPSTDKVKPVRAGRSTPYDRYMDAGYEADRAKNYKVALLFFRRALDERPNDTYAVTAIQNTEAQQLSKERPAPTPTPTPSPSPSPSIVVPTTK